MLILTNQRQNYLSNFSLAQKSQLPSKLKFLVLKGLRRASDTRALNRKVSTNDIDVVNRWKKVEGGKGRKASGSMRQHCAEFTYLLELFLRCTGAM